MSNIEKIVTIANDLFWTWRLFSFLYSSYTVTENVTPASVCSKIKNLLMLSLMAASTILHAMNLKDSPHLSLANTIISIPSQLHTILFLHTYIGPALDSTHFTVFLYIMSFFSIMETMYLIYVDIERME